jgi:uncharacterized phage infection (PIP) family protein YhgE
MAHAKVTSIDALPLLAAAMQKFRGQAAAALDDMEIELRRVSDWIHTDRKQYWAKELNRAYERLTQARLQLQQARVSRRVADHDPSCVDEKRAVDKAKRRVELAHQKVDAVRRWSGQIDKAIDDFRRVRTQFAAWLEMDLQKSVAVLNQMSESLVTYITMQAGPKPEMPQESSPPADEQQKESPP